MRIALIGGEGVGKSTLAYSLSNYLSKHAATATVNLDPKCRHIKFKPVFDVRKLGKLDKTLPENKALSKIYSEAAPKLKREQRGFDFVVMDVYGGLDFFLLDEGGDLLRKNADLVLLLAENNPDALDAVSGVAESAIEIPVLPVINKSDLIEKTKKQRKLTSARSHKTTGKRVLFVSAWEREGLRDLFNAIIGYR